MNKLLKVFQKIAAVVLVSVMMTLPVCAAGEDYGIMPCFNNVNTARLSLSFDRQNNVYCGLSLTMFSHGSGVSGLMRLYDSAGNSKAVWSVSDYVRPIDVENIFEGDYGETYTLTFEGHAYSNNGTPSDWLDLEITATLTY